MVEYTRPRYPKALLRLMHGLIIVLVPVLLVIASVRLVMNPLFLQIEYTRPGFPQDPFGFSTEDRLQYGPLGIEYILNGDDISFLADLRLPLNLCFMPTRNQRDCPMYNTMELRHMEDVKQVAQIAFATGLIGAIIALLIGAALARSMHRHILKIGLMQGSLLTMGLIATIIVIALAAWDLFFDTFHALFFEQGTWRFYTSDTLIRLYPEQFWFDASVTVGVLTTLGALLILVSMWRWQPK